MANTTILVRVVKARSLTVEAYRYPTVLQTEVRPDRSREDWEVAVWEANDEYIAQYQADRLSSGLIGARVIDYANLEAELATF
jgi:hypothetical protein